MTDPRQPERRQSGEAAGQVAARRGRSLLARIISRFFGSVISKVIAAALIALIALITLFAVAKATQFHFPFFKSHTTVSALAVRTKLVKIEKLHVATASYRVNVAITQSVGIIPCFLVCNHMQLRGTGTDDAILNLSGISRGDVSVSGSAVTIRLRPPAIGPAVLNPARCDISSSHGVMNSLTQDFRNNPNGYRPLYREAQRKIHDMAARDPRLLAAGERSARKTLARLLRAVGAKKVTVVFR